MILRICLCIPTYNNPQTIEAVILDCLQKTDFPLLVVDDGSNEPVQNLLHSSVAREAIQRKRLRLIRFPQNQGKGIALREAINDCVKLGFTHLFAIDGDGQHLASEIPKLVKLAQTYPWDLIIGNRKLNASTVPGTSKFGRKFSNFWVNFQTGTAITDSQSGFRLYPLFHLQNMSFWTRKYDFEIEVLIRLLWKGISTHETEIEVYYPPQEERISHFNKFWDNARISLLNTFLVILSLLKTPRSPSASSIALGIGVWVGCTPFFGFHTLIVAGIAAIFRLNAVLLLLGSQISILPLVPLLVLASVNIGTLIAPQSAHSLRYFVGSFILGGLLCLLTGGTFFFLSVHLRKKSGKGSTWNGRTRGGIIGNWILKQITRCLGLRAAYGCLVFIIPYFYIFAPKARRSANEYWSVREPQLGFFQRQRLILRQLYTFAQVLLDCLYQSFHQRNQFISNPNGIENILEAVQARKGLILLSAHVGGWDLAASLLQNDGLSGDFHMVQYQSPELNFEKVKGEVRPDSLKSLASNFEGQPVFKIRELLDLGLPVGLMGDRPLSQHFELVSFLGKLAPFDVTPFRIAAACNRPLLFTFGFKGKGKIYDFYATPSRLFQYPQGASKILQCYQWVQEYANDLEQMLKRYPEQWYNFYPFWSSLPAPPMTSSSSKVQNHLLEEVSKLPRSAPERELAATATV